MGPWTHGPARKTGDLQLPANFLYDFQTDTIRFFAHWLQDADNGIMSEPAVRDYTLGDVDDAQAPGNEWRTADAWPPFATDQTAFYLHADGLLSSEPPTADDAKRTFVYDPKHACPTHGGPNLLLPAGPFDQRRLVDRADVITFSTPSLEHPVEITGRVIVRLHVSSDAPDTDFVAKLIDIYPDGRQILMLDGIRRVKYRNGFSKPDPLPVGQIGTVEIDLWSISLIVNKGHRIGVHITSSNWPRFEKNPNTGDDFPSADGLRTAHNTVHTSAAHASALLLPVRP
jgi:putative CocE/NonD family hydrolase